MTLLDLFDASRAERAGAFAVNDATYAELHAGSLRVARRLAEAGIGRGSRLALFTENRLAFVYAYLAALRLGAVAVPVNVLYRAAELEHILEDSGVTAIVASGATRAHLTPMAPIVEAGAIEAWASDAAIAEFVPERAPSADDDAIILYTSGTTGRSKGAVLTHGNAASIASQVAIAWRWTAADTLYVALPLFHMHGLGAALNGTFTAGARLIFDERFDARRALAALRTGGITMFFGVPTMYVRLLEALDAGEPTPPRLRLWVSGSAALPAEIFDAFERRCGAQILERYGASEFGFALSNRFGGPRVPGSVGIPTPGTRVRIVAPQSLAPVDAGEVGELLVSGPGVARGYWNAPRATAEAFAVDDEGTRWYRSGDLATYDTARDVYRIVGRLKELIITGGFNVYPLEVETELGRVAGIRACAVVGIADPARGEVPIAYVETDGNVDLASVRLALGERLASFKIPREIRVVEALPRNAMGKIEKHRLRGG